MQAPAQAKPDRTYLALEGMMKFGSIKDAGSRPSPSEQVSRVRSAYEASSAAPASTRQVIG